MLKLPKGHYYIGDPCYVCEGALYEKINDQVCSDDIIIIEDEDGIERHVFAASTEFGDGVYTDNSGLDYSVDSGIIAVIPLELLDLDADTSGGSVVEHKRSFSVSCENGTFTIGSVIIPTGDLDAMDSEEFDEYGEEFDDGDDSVYFDD